MCLTSVAIYEKDNEYLDRLRDKFKLKSKAAVLELIMNLIKKHKLEGELR